jgi:hypothetical protein
LQLSAADGKEEKQVYLGLPAVSTVLREVDFRVWTRGVFSQ